MRLAGLVFLFLATALFVGCGKPDNVFNEDDAEAVITKNWKKVISQCLELGVDIPPDSDFEIKNVKHEGKTGDTTAEIKLKVINYNLEERIVNVHLALSWMRDGSYTISSLKTSKIRWWQTRG